MIHLKENDKVHIIFDILPLHQFGLAAINLIKLNDWSTDYLKMVLFDWKFRRFDIFLVRIAPSSSEI